MLRNVFAHLLSAHQVQGPKHHVPLSVRHSTIYLVDVNGNKDSIELRVCDETAARKLIAALELIVNPVQAEVV